MARVGRLFIIGSLAVGLLLVVAFAFSGNLGKAYGQTGYGNDTVPPTQLATGPVSHSSDGAVWIALATGGFLVITAGGAVYWRKTHP